MKLKNKVAVVTGGNSGVGFGIAQAFKNNGATGSITGRDSYTIEQSLKSLGDGFLGLQGDVTKIDELEPLFKTTADKFGKIDILVVNAGGAAEGAQFGSVADVGEESFDKFLALNLKSVYFTVQKALPYMNNGASIILIGSVAAQKAAQGMTIYSAAKAAVTSFARGFSQDLLERRIRVNVITLGPVDTPIFKKLMPEEHVEYAKQLFAKSIPIGRLGKPSDIGGIAVFLGSDDSAFLVGSEIVADGGFTSLSTIN
jgi:NAD(P)-dependent dehydrogenase (short-subunit alcohol dehydrogenase family)